MKEFIIKTAWPMVPPRPYSAFHICIMAAGFLAAVLAAYFLSRKTERKFFYTAAVFLRRNPGRKRDLQAAVPVLRGKSGAIRLVVFPVSAVQPSHVFLPAPASRKKQEAAADYPDLYAGF